MAGDMAKSSKLRVGFFAQHQLDELVEGDSAYQHIVRLRPEENEKNISAPKLAAPASTMISLTCQLKNYPGAKKHDY